MEFALHEFQHLVSNSTVAVFADNSTDLAYLRKQGGTRSLLLNSIAQRILCWAESIDLTLVPQFIQGKNNVLADSLSRPNQIQGSEWTLKWEVFQELNHKWLVMIDLFATSLNHSCSLYFSPFCDPSAIGRSSSELGRVSGVCLSTLFNDTARSEEAPVILWGPHDSCCSLLAPETVVSGPSGTSGRRSNRSTSLPQSSQSTAVPLSSSRDRQAVSSCLETIQQFARSQGFFSRVAKQLGFARRSSSRAVYQSKWLVYRGWCRGEGHSISRPTLPKVGDFLLWLHHTRKLSVSAVMGYRSMLSAVFRFKLPEISTSLVLQDLLRSFQVAAPSHSIQPPSWDLNKVLTYLRSSTFEPLQSVSLRSLSKKTLFLVSLATARWVSELQALSDIVSFSSEGAVVSYVPEFLAKTESALRPLPHSLVKSLTDFAAGLDEDLLLCPVRCLRVYLQRTAPGVNRPRR